ncbi:hypothetical protein CRUP_013396 [Coryphaenoides rupestris]|nr:hypothetical protein CRUP_013396 [Coryphaenoides rupestris]
MWGSRPFRQTSSVDLTSELFLFHSVTISYPEPFTQCTTRGSFSSRWQETAYNMFTFCCLFPLPLLVMTTCYTRIFCEISKRMRKDNREFAPGTSHKKRACGRWKMSIVIVLSFIVCWTPYYLLGLWYWFFPDDLEGKVSHSLTHILFIFGLFNACLDPVIYGLFTVHFRKGLLTRYCRRRRKRRNRRNLAATSDLENSTAVTGTFSAVVSQRQCVLIAASWLLFAERFALLTAAVTVAVTVAVAVAVVTGSFGASALAGVWTET